MYPLQAADRTEKEGALVTATRAMWKGVIRLGTSELPVKLYSAVKESSIRFRLLHKTDLQPVRQKMIDPETSNEVSFAEVRKAFPVTKSSMVILGGEDLAALEPEESRDIEITRFVNPSELDHRWYDRAYYLGPDGSTDAYFALAQALEQKGKEGIARWAMRKKSYIGSLRFEDGYLMLIVLRHADEIVDAEHLEPPKGRPLEKREIAMAEQLVGALAGTFDPEEFRDEYRDRVLELIEAKAKGRKPKVEKFRPRKVDDDDSLDKALEASLAATGKWRSAGGRG